MEDSPFREDWIKCSLCNTPNKYIFYIENRYNKKKLNVGSECIEKFPDLDNRLPNGMTIRKLKNNTVKDYNRLKRLEEFNHEFPNVEEILSSWNNEYNNLPIILPRDLHNSITEIHAKANEIFKGYINGSREVKHM